MRKKVSKLTDGKGQRSGEHKTALSPGDVPALGIRDAVVDQNGGRWIKYGSSDHAAWFAVPDLVARPMAVFERLAKAGVSLATSANQNRVKVEVDARTSFRPGLVADRPGWVSGRYVMGNGDVIRARGDDGEIIIAFETNPKFTPADGSLADWQNAIAPFIPKQPLVRFALAASLIGPLLRYAPKDFDNPIIEYVGEPERGKSTVMTLATSVWAGNPDGGTGGAESWAATVASFDQQRMSHADNVLALDEGGHMPGGTPREKQDVVEKVVFKFASTSHTRRMGDSAISRHTRGVLLSNTNTRLSALLPNTSAATRDALLSRIVTVEIGKDRPFGVFTVVPAGFQSSATAIRALRNACEVAYGTAGRAFVAAIVAATTEDLTGFERLLADKLEAEERRFDDLVLPGRVRKTLALAAVAGLLAQRYGVFPKEWGGIRRSVRIVAQRAAAVSSAQPRSAISRVLAYLKQHEDAVIDVAKLSGPLNPTVFEQAAGFRRIGRNGDSELLIPTVRLQREMPDHRSVMRELRDAGQARIEPGEQSKLSIKAPRSICSAGRVYCISLSSA